MRQLRIILAFLLLAPESWADSVAFSSELIKEDIAFGDLKITKIYDGRDSTNLPIWAIEIRKDDQLISRIVDASFDDYSISPRSSIFVGISNFGYPDTAYVVFDNSGKLVLFRRHHVDMDWYCEFTVSAIREWYDDESPEITFTDVGFDSPEFITMFSVIGCKGEKIDIKIR